MVTINGKEYARVYCKDGYSVLAVADEVSERCRKNYFYSTEHVTDCVGQENVITQDILLHDTPLGYVTYVGTEVYAYDLDVDVED